MSPWDAASPRCSPQACGSPTPLRLQVIEMQSTHGRERSGVGGGGGEKKREESLIKVSVHHFTPSRQFAKHQTYPSERNNSLVSVPSLLDKLTL